LLKQYEGWPSSMRAAPGPAFIYFLFPASLLDEQALSAEAAIAGRKRSGGDGDAHATELLETDALELRVRAVEEKTGFARVHRIKRSLFDSQEFRSLARVHAQLIELA